MHINPKPNNPNIKVVGVGGAGRNAVNYLQLEQAGQGAEIIFRVRIDEALDNYIWVTVIVTGFSENLKQTLVHA